MDQVLEIRYDAAILKMYRIIMCFMIAISPIVAYLSWDSLVSDRQGNHFLLYEFDGVYILVTIVIVIQYLRMKKCRMVRTETSVICYTMFRKREVSFQELREMAQNNPVKQQRKGYVFATKGSPLHIPYVDYSAK